MDKTVYVVAESHIDPVWLWDKYEGIDEVINTFRSACDRLDEYPYLKFSATSICFYKWVEEFAPDVFARMIAHIASGRWEVLGGWLVETDCNLPLAESFRKSAEISRKYVQSRFGVETPVVHCPDTFGHAASLPEILVDSGFRYYVFVRPGEHEKSDLPASLFYWEHGGKRVLCYRPRYSGTLGSRFTRELAESQLCSDELYENGPACYFFGLGDHGGGPTKLEIEAIQAIQTENKSLDVRFSTCREFFEVAEKLPNIPTYTGDLHYHAVGCYSVNRDIKQANRTAERSLCYTKRVMDATGIPSDDELDPLWEQTIFNQFHDILPGSCAPHAAIQALNELAAVQDAADTLAYRALKTLSSNSPVKCPQGEFRIFNSLDDPITGPFEIENFMYFRPGAPFKDSTGRKLPIQKVPPSVLCSNRRWVFIDTIPARSLKSYYFDSEDTLDTEHIEEVKFLPGDSISLGESKIESPGTMSFSGKSLFLSPIKLGVLEDESDTWSHYVRGYGPSTGYFTEEISTLFEGNIASMLISRQRFGHSFADLQYTIYKDAPYIDLRIKVRWEQVHSILKLELEPEGPFDSFLLQGPGAAIEKRTDGAEEPLHGWLLVGDVGIVQDGAFAMDRLGGKLRVTLVRSNLYGYHIPSVIDPNGPQEYTDLGEHEFNLRFIKKNGLDSKSMESILAAFVEPLKVVRDGKS